MILGCMQLKRKILASKFTKSQSLLWDVLNKLEKLQNLKDLLLRLGSDTTAPSEDLWSPWLDGVGPGLYEIAANLNVLNDLFISFVLD